MRCLLDKVTARYTLEGMLRLAEGRKTTDAEVFSLSFYRRALLNRIDLYILPQTQSFLKRLEHLSRYVILIQRFLTTTQVLYPTRYFKRWTRRVHEYGFSKEDSEVLALATFGSSLDRDFIGIHTVVTFDQSMINLWNAKQAEIYKRLMNMRHNLNPPYCNVSLPIVQNPQHIVNLKDGD